jgi:hypothetical protein
MHAFKVKIRNHTDKDIEVDIKTSGALDKKNKTVKANDRKDFDIAGESLTGINVETKNGKRKGSSGPGKCKGTFYHVKSDGTKQKYQYGCKHVGGLGEAGNPFFDVFMPSSNDYWVDSTNKATHIKDNGDNLIVVRRYGNIKY